MRKLILILSLLLVCVNLFCACDSSKTVTPNTVRELLESEGWEYSREIETDLVCQWYGVTFISSGSKFDLFKKGQIYCVTLPHSDNAILEKYSHVDGYLTTEYWIRYYAYTGDYTVRGNQGTRDREDIVTKHYWGHTEEDHNNNNAMHYFKDENNGSHNEVTQGNSSNNNENSSEMEEPTQKYKQCPVCYGLGKCGGCGGSGTVYNSIDYHPGQYIDCSACGGTGRCGACDGSGVVEDFGW